MTNTTVAVYTVVFWTGMLVWFIRTITETSLMPTWLTLLITLVVLGWIAVATNIILKANLDDKQEETEKARKG